MRATPATFAYETESPAPAPLGRGSPPCTPSTSSRTGSAGRTPTSSSQRHLPLVRSLRLTDRGPPLPLDLVGRADHPLGHVVEAVLPAVRHLGQRLGDPRVPGCRLVGLPRRGVPHPGPGPRQHPRNAAADGSGPSVRRARCRAGAASPGDGAPRARATSTKLSRLLNLTDSAPVAPGTARSPGRLSTAPGRRSEGRALPRERRGSGVPGRWRR